MDNPLKEEFEFYKEKQKELVNKYSGRFLVIKDKKVVADFPTELEAYTEAKKLYELGTFLIQECVSGAEGYTQTFYSRMTV